MGHESRTRAIGEENARYLYERREDEAMPGGAYSLKELAPKVPDPEPDIVDRGHTWLAAQPTDRQWRDLVREMLDELKCLRFELDCAREERDQARGEASALKANMRQPWG